MAYDNATFAARAFVKVQNAVSFGTATASATDGANITPTCPLPQFPRRTAVNKVQMIVTTAPDSGSTALKAHFLNGTSTFGVVTLTTATAGQVVNGTITTANSTFTAASAPTVKLTGTATASADANGSYDIYFETQELAA